MHFKLRFLFILFLGFCSSGFTQEISADSIEKMSFDDFHKIFIKTRIANDTILEKKYTDIFYKKSFKTRDTIEMCRGYFFKSYASYNSLETNLKYADSIIALSKYSKHIYYPTAGYIAKAYNYDENGSYNKALDNYLIALEYAKKKNSQKDINYIKESIAELKGLGGDYIGSLRINKSIYDSITKLPNFKEKHTDNYYNSLFILIFDYINLKKTDSATLFINEGITKFKPHKSKLDITYYDFVFLSGINKYYKKEYQQSIDSLKKAYQHINDPCKSFCHLFMSNIYNQRKEQDLFLYHAINADSLLTIEDRLSYEYRELYENLIDHYKTTDDTKKELKYLNRIITLDSTLKQNLRLKEQIIKKYDTPYLLNQKQKIITQLNTAKQKDKLIKIGLVSAFILSLFAAGYYFKKQRNYLKKYKALISSNNESLSKTPIKDINKTSELSHIILEDLQKGLDQFEANNRFLEPKLTLSKLAEQLNTNTNYLSKAVKVIKGSSYTNYLNTLRINYIIEQLKQDHTLRRYTIKAIAKEAGYNNAQSFSTAFYKQTGIYPSYFLNKLNKSKELEK